MKIKIKAIENAGDRDRECLVLEVVKDTDIGKYILLDFAFSKIVHTFWFPDMPVKQGDLICLYTTLSPEEVNDTVDQTGFVHQLHWNLPEPKWAKKQDCVALIEANDWSFQEIHASAA